MKDAVCELCGARGPRVFGRPWRAAGAGATPAPTPAPAVPLTRKELHDELYRNYTEEGQRYEALNNRGSAYLTVVGALSVFAAFKLDAIANQIMSSHVTLLLGLLAGVAVLATMVLIALSLRIRNYLSPGDPLALVEEIEANHYTAEDTYTVLLASLVEATDENRKINNDRAQLLSWALLLALVAVFGTLAFNVSVYLLAIK